MTNSFRDLIRLNILDRRAWRKTSKPCNSFDFSDIIFTQPGLYLFKFDDRNDVAGSIDGKTHQ